MTFAEFLNHAQEFAEKNPEALKYQVITSSDPEGNQFFPVEYTPQAGEFNGNDFEPDKSPNAVLIN